VERRIAIEELRQPGAFREAFAVRHRCRHLGEALVAIQEGRGDDVFGWRLPVRARVAGELSGV
jgi:hypothetical protein